MLISNTTVTGTAPGRTLMRAPYLENVATVSDPDVAPLSLLHLHCPAQDALVDLVGGVWQHYGNATLVATHGVSGTARPLPPSLSLSRPTTPTLSFFCRCRVQESGLVRPTPSLADGFSVE